MSSPEELEMEALKVLHDGHLQNVHALSERPFEVVLQTVTFNVVVVAGLVAGEVELSQWGKVLGTVLLAVFNLAVIAYILRQGSIHKDERERYVQARDALRAKCQSLPSQASSSTDGCCVRCLTGTSLFVLVVLTAAAFSITALWVPFTTQSSKHSANHSIERTATGGLRPPASAAHVKR